jgi:hypothetical protein
MQKRAVRLTILSLLLVANVAAAVVLLSIEQRLSALTATDTLFAERIERLGDTIGSIASAQQGYVAPGQLDEPWFERTSTLFDQLNRNLVALRADGGLTDANTTLAALDASSRALIAADRRIRENVTQGQELMAADVIFSDGLNLADTFAGQLRELRDAERGRSSTARAALEQERWTVLGATMLFSLCVGVALVPIPRRETASSDDGLASLAAAITPDTPPKAASSVDLNAAAALCMDLSRITDASALSGFLARTATLLDASGAIVWLGAGAQMFPVLGHGYTPQSLARFGPIARDADNAVANAWRTGRAAIFPGQGDTRGAIVAPMLAPEGCIGVLALESRATWDDDPALPAIASMIAAQVATQVAAWPSASGTHPASTSLSEARPARSQAVRSVSG